MTEIWSLASLFITRDWLITWLGHPVNLSILPTLVCLIMTGYIVAGKNSAGYKYGGIAEKPPKVCLFV